jgi:protein strawberry notch
MTISSLSAAAIAAARSSVPARNSRAAADIVAAARLIASDLERGRRIDAAILRIATESAFGGSDAQGAWDWKTACGACAAATVLFLRKFGIALRFRAASPGAMLPMLAKIAGGLAAESGLLSAARLETVIHAGEAHCRFLKGSWTVDESFEAVAAARDDATTAVRFRFMLGDGTGAGKGRQAGGILLDNRLKGRRKAVRISRSDRLIDDAQRDWTVPGQQRLPVTPLSRLRQGTPIGPDQGVLFTTYATLRSDARDGPVSQVEQIVEWVGANFDGVIVFDESDAMLNAAGGNGERGDKSAPQHGRAGLRPAPGRWSSPACWNVTRSCVSPNGRRREMHRDAADLVHRLGRDAAAVCRHYRSNGRRFGNSRQVGDVRNASGRSMFVRLKDTDAGGRPAGKRTLRICARVLSRGRLTASTQHNACALREFA